MPAPSVTLALLGDVMLGRAVHASDVTFNYLKPYLESADLALANLESPLTDAPSLIPAQYSLCASPGNARYLADAGFDFLSLANNHHLDCGENGLAETESTLANAGLGSIGPGLQPIIRDINGVKLAFLAFDATGDFDLKTAIQDVQTAGKTGAVVIISIHWGLEYQTGASIRQKQIASQLANAGAVLIWGHHPHVLQPVEWLGSGKTLVFYSLGNALFDQGGLEATHQSALVLVKMEADGVKEINIFPFSIDLPHSRIVEANPKSVKSILSHFKLTPFP